ncbi:DUF2793 domain-containing protein [Rhizobium leguminosarum]
MDRINGAGTIDIGGGRRGFRDENLEVGNEGTEVTALFMNMVQEELAKVIEDAGIVLSSADWTQLRQALRILNVASLNRRWAAVISMTLSSAPGAPTLGDTYLIPSNATGIWAANIGKIAEWSGSAWSYLSPPDGHGVSLPDGRVYERIAGTYVEKIAQDVQSGKWSYTAAAGTANALTVALTPSLPAYQDGTVVYFKAAVTNAAGGVTLKVNALAAIPLVNLDGSALVQGHIQPLAPYAAMYVGGNFVLISNPGAATQAEADAGLSNGRFLTPATQKNAIRFFDARMTGSQSLPSGVMTTPTIDAAVENGLVDSTIFTSSKITVGARDAGVWMVMAYIQYTGANSNKSLRIHRNGASTSYSTPSRIGVSQNGVGQANDTYTVAVMMRLAAGDQVSADVLHTIGSTQTLSDGRFVAVRLGS